MKRALILFIYGTVVFFLSWKYTILGFWLSSLAGLGALITLRIILKAVDKKRKQGAPGFKVTQKTVDDVSKDGRERLKGIRNLTIRIKNNEAAEKIKEICKIGFEIFDDIKKNPGDLKRAKPFLNYYLDTTEKIVKQYVELSNAREDNPEVKKTLSRVEDLLDSIKETYEKQLANLLTDDLLDLNTEITVLKKTMELEG